MVEGFPDSLPKLQFGLFEFLGIVMITKSINQMARRRLPFVRGGWFEQCSMGIRVGCWMKNLLFFLH
jgi:hypothetical protein